VTDKVQTFDLSQTFDWHELFRTDLSLPDPRTYIPSASDQRAHPGEDLQAFTVLDDFNSCGDARSGDERHCKQCPVQSNRREQSRLARVRQIIHMTLNDHHYSLTALAYNYLMMCNIIVSILGFVLETVPALEEHLDAFQVLERVTGWLYAVDLALSAASCFSLKSYIKDIKNWLDIMAVLPIFVQDFLPALHSSFSVEGGSSNVKLFVMFRLLKLGRIFQLMKLPALHKTVQVLTMTMINSVTALIYFFGMVCLVLTMVGTFFYAYEKGEWDSTTQAFVRPLAPPKEVKSPVQSVPEAFWWGLQTMTAEGYGDVFPVTTGGRIVGTITSIIGVLVLAVPISMMSTFFMQAFNQVQTRTTNIHMLVNELEEIEADLKSRFSELELYFTKASNDNEAVVGASADPSVSTLSPNPSSPKVKQKLMVRKLNKIGFLLCEMVVDQLMAVRKFVSVCRMTHRDHWLVSRAYHLRKDLPAINPLYPGKAIRVRSLVHAKSSKRLLPAASQSQLLNPGRQEDDNEDVEAEAHYSPSPVVKPRSLPRQQGTRGGVAAVLVGLSEPPKGWQEPPQAGSEQGTGQAGRTLESGAAAAAGAASPSPVD